MVIQIVKYLIVAYTFYNNLIVFLKKQNKLTTTTQ